MKVPRWRITLQISLENYTTAYCNQERDDQLWTNGVDTENTNEFPIPQHVNERQAINNAKMSTDSKGNGASLVLDYVKRNSMMKDENHEIQPLRRSLSVDSLAAENISEAVLSLCMADNEELLLNPRFDVHHDYAKLAGGNGNSRTQRIVGGSSITVSTQESSSDEEIIFL